MPRMNERARQDWATLRSLHGKKRLEHIWSYYKLPIVIALILLYMAGYAVYRQATKRRTCFIWRWSTSRRATP